MIFKNTAYAVIDKLWPFLLLPITLFAVIRFGNPAGDLILGAVLFFLITRESDYPTKRLILSMAVFSIVFEIASVASGSYKYLSTTTVSLWVSFFWGILGWWVASLEFDLSKIPFKYSFAFASMVTLSCVFLGSGLSINIPITLAGLYAMSKMTKKPFALLAFASFVGVFCEYAGTSFKVWTYLSDSGTGAAVQPDFAALALIYPAVLLFCFWISGYEKTQ